MRRDEDIYVLELIIINICAIDKHTLQEHKSRLTAEAIQRLR